MTTSPTPLRPFAWQAEKRLASGDRIFILTDIFRYRSAFHEWSTERRWFKVGALDLATGKLGCFRFSLDDARAMMLAEIPPPPWSQPLPHGIELKRQAHATGDKGRFRETISLIEVDPAVAAMATEGTRFFARLGHVPNAQPGMWRELVEWAAVEIRIERAALDMTKSFVAGDVRTMTGAASARVTRVLRRLVGERRLHVAGKKRGTRYARFAHLLDADVG